MTGPRPETLALTGARADLLKRIGSAEAEIVVIDRLLSLSAGGISVSVGSPPDMLVLQRWSDAPVAGNVVLRAAVDAMLAELKVCAQREVATATQLLADLKAHEVTRCVS